MSITSATYNQTLSYTQYTQNTTSATTDTASASVNNSAPKSYDTVSISIEALEQRSASISDKQRFPFPSEAVRRLNEAHAMKIGQIFDLSSETVRQIAQANTCDAIDIIENKIDLFAAKTRDLLYEGGNHYSLLKYFDGGYVRDSSGNMMAIKA